jgi:hypothetical protein
VQCPLRSNSWTHLLRLSLAVLIRRWRRSLCSSGSQSAALCAMRIALQDRLSGSSFVRSVARHDANDCLPFRCHLIDIRGSDPGPPCIPARTPSQQRVPVYWDIGASLRQTIGQMSQRFCRLVLTLQCNFHVLRFSMFNATCITQYRSTFLEVLQQHGRSSWGVSVAAAASHPVSKLSPAWLHGQYLRSRRLSERQRPCAEFDESG